MSFSWQGFFVGVAGSLAFVGHAPAAALLVPAYFDPFDHASEWSQLNAAASRVSVTAIFNPNSGPGAAVDTGYVATLAAFRGAGGKAVGYVHTQNADGTLRTLAAVEAEVDQYRAFYTFDGIFVDEMTSDTKSSHLTFYTNLYKYIKSKNAAYTVIGNPGTNVPVDYAAVADVLVTEEESQANYPAYTPSAWTKTRPAAGFGNILHDAPADTLNATLAQAASQNVGYVYVTDDGADGNPYNSLPSYWAAEVNAVVPEPTGSAMFAMGAIALGRRRRSKVTEEHA